MREGWKRTTLGAVAKRLVNGGTPPTEIEAFWNGTTPWITGADFTSRGVEEFRRFVSAAAVRQTSTNVIQQGQLLIVTRTGVGKLALAPCDIAISQDITGLYVDETKADPRFLFHRMRIGVQDLKKLNQGTSINGIIRSDLTAYPLDLPPLPVQKRIADILSTLDSAIEQAEALIAKLVCMREGLINDLFTRGLRGNGTVRPEQRSAPDLFASSPLGSLPSDWQIRSVDQVAQSLVDGPFGSNLKSEHYVDEPGVRVVRLQNVGSGTYSDSDKAFVSQRHAAYLSRHEVLSGDVLVAGLGDEAHAVGRACCYPAELPPAINKADCFRLRCDASQALNPYVMLFLNTSRARHQVRRYEQGVTRLRMNLGNLRRIQIPLPSLQEQRMVIERVAAGTADIEAAVAQHAKAVATKQGLGADLLSGRVAVDGC